jgi:pheromone shutdown protein TraB
VSEALPPLYDVMITKRDVHMAKMLRKHCSEGKVVAVVGAGHVEGIEREWEV